MKVSDNAMKRVGGLNRVNMVDILILCFVGFFCLMIIYPFYNSILVSITPQKVYIREPFMLYPKALSWDSYRFVFENKIIWTGMATTAQVTVIGTLYNLTLTVTMAYAFIHKFPGKRFFLGLILFTMYFSGGLVPTYMLINDLKLMNSIFAMILPTGINITYLMVMQKYLRSIPEEMEESARIDGANDLTIMLRIILPLALPMVVTFIIYYGVDRWNEWYNGMLYIKSARKMPLQLVLRNIVANAQTLRASESMVEAGIVPFSDGIKMATVVVTMFPVMLLYPFMQKHFVSGLTTGAVKG